VIKNFRHTGASKRFGEHDFRETNDWFSMDEALTTHHGMPLSFSGDGHFLATSSSPVKLGVAQPMNTCPLDALHECPAESLEPHREGRGRNIHLGRHLFDRFEAAVAPLEQIPLGGG
jgi:hypothetical protein